MKLRNLPHLVSEGFVSTWRNGVMTTASVLVLVCCMLVLGTFYTVADNLSAFINNSLDEMRTINAYVDASKTADELKAYEAEIVKLKSSGMVSGYTLITKEQAKENWALEDPTLAPILDQFDKNNNPLPNTFAISFNDFDDAQQLMRELTRVFGDENIDSRVNTYDNIINMRDTISLIGIGLMAVLLVVSVLVIMNTVRLTVYARRKDIKTMRYIGATSAFVTAPFVVEGMVIGVISAIISCGIQYYLYTQVITDIVSGLQQFALVPVSNYYLIIPGAFLALGIFAGVFASTISVKKHLNV